MTTLNLTRLLTLSGSDDGKSRVRQALEDAAIIFAYTMIGSLIALGWPPEMHTVYVPLLSALLMGITTYAKARDVPLEEGA
jgi:hypothetical protein